MNSSAFQELNSFNEEFSDHDVSSDGLEIDISESPSCNKHEINVEDKKVLENIEEEIERQYDEKAAKSNLTAVNVKNILKHVITNEEVWAMVRNSADEGASAELTYEPKFTRAKAKELLKIQSVAALPWAKPKPTSEVHILINEELPEDSDDDEYVPHEEESEDDKESGNTSEIDSQPPTPATPTSTHDTSTQTNWTEDGVFKIPQSTKIQETQENNENIALRTRSKLSLSDTPLEIIEEAFIPPDITTDMYDFECDDEDWKDFLKKFTRPLDEAVHGTQEDDDEADPEYNILADEEIDKVDKEELRQDRAVKITKKELNTLVAELFEFSEMFANSKQFENDLNQNSESLIENGNKNTYSNENKNSSNELQTETSSSVQEDPPLSFSSQESFNQNNQEQENINDNNIALKIEYSYTIKTSVITENQRSILDQQLRQHIQLLTQSFMMSYQHPHFGYMAQKFKGMIMSFDSLYSDNSNSVYNILNLQGAVNLIKDWQNLFDSDTDEAKATIEHFKNKRFTFPALLLKTISKSMVFIYPELLPELPFILSTRKRSSYLPSENELIAIGLEQFYKYLEKDVRHKSKFGKIKLGDIAHYISHYMMPHKYPSRLYSHIKQMYGKDAPPNPIKYYFAHKKVPVTTHKLIDLSTFLILPPCERSINLLPDQWQKSRKNKQVSKSKRILKPPAYNKKPRICTKKQKFSREKQANIINYNQLIRIDSNSALAQYSTLAVPTYFLINNLSIQNKRHETIIPSNIFKPKQENVYLTTPGNILIETTTQQSKKPEITSALCNEKQNNSTETSSINSPKENGLVTNKYISTKLLEFKFNSSIFKNLKENRKMLPSMPFLFTPGKDVLEDEDIPTVQQSKQSTLKIQGNEKNVPEESGNFMQKDNERDDEDELNALMVASTTIQQKNKRIQPNLTKKAKQIREYNATLGMLCPEDQKVTEEKAKNYAQAYYDKVQERLITSPLEYQKFMQALSEHDETKSSVSDLYEKVSAVLSPEHPDLCEEFLTFLTPEQAQQIGKLVPHYMFTNMSLFLRKLEIYYSNQPAQLRRIFNSLTELAEKSDITMDKVRSSILPLLKGNSLLIDWFLQMFPTETPPESLMMDWEELSCDDGDEIHNDEKGFETLTLPEVEDPYGGPNCICKCHKIADAMYASRSRHCIPCGTKFLQGRVYVQTGKGLRLANVTFNTSSTLDQSKRLSVKPFVRQKKKSENSPSKILVSSLKDDEPRHSNESEDDNIENNSKKNKTSKTFTTTISPLKNRKKMCNNKSIIKVIKKEMNKKINKKGVSKQKLIKNLEEHSECDLKQTEIILSCPETTKSKEISETNTKNLKTEFTENEVIKQGTSENENDLNDWDLKTSPEHSVESMDTCEESSQDSIHAHDSESDDSIMELESVNSDNSDDSCNENENSHLWTRDEDKVILEMFQKSEDSQNVFKEIQQLLPNRAMWELKQRFHVLMNLLQKMTSSTSK